MFYTRYALYHPETGEHLGDFNSFDALDYVHEITHAFEHLDRTGKGGFFRCFWGKYFIYDWGNGALVFPMKGIE